jgi:hypothetical protein
VVEKNVARFDVAVDDAVAVRMLQGARDTAGERHRLGHG